MQSYTKLGGGGEEVPTGKIKRQGIFLLFFMFNTIFDDPKSHLLCLFIGFFSHCTLLSCILASSASLQQSTRFATICFILICGGWCLGSNSHSRFRSTGCNTLPWRIGDCYMRCVQDLVEILATLLVIIFIIMLHHATMLLKQSLRNILGVHVHHVKSCGYPNT